ncbi:MAG: YybH family protein [Anaerolineales bacterium]
MKRLTNVVIVIVLLALAIFSAASAASPANEVPAVRQAIEEANEVFMAAFNAHDGAGLAELYTEDAQLMPPNADFVIGREAIEQFWPVIFESGIDSALLEIREVDALGNTAVEVSNYTLYLADGTIADQGKYMIEWKRVAGKWYIHRDIFNSSLPLP